MKKFLKLFCCCLIFSIILIIVVSIFAFIFTKIFLFNETLAMIVFVIILAFSIMFSIYSDEEEKENR